MKRGRGGVQYEDIAVGDGSVVGRDSTVDVIYTLSLNKGDIVQADMRYSFRPSERSVIAGLAYGVEGMHVGGRRRIRIGAHLAYRQAGVPERIPPDAVVIFDLTVLAIREGDRS